MQIAITHVATHLATALRVDSLSACRTRSRCNALHADRRKLRRVVRWATRNGMRLQYFLRDDGRGC